MKKYNEKVKTFLDNSCYEVNLHFSWTYEHIECTPKNSGENGIIGDVVHHNFALTWLWPTLLPCLQYFMEPPYW